MTRREQPPTKAEIAGLLSRRAFLGFAGALLINGLIEPTDTSGDPDGSKEKLGPSEVPMMQGELSKALEQYKSSEEIACHATLLLLELFQQNGGFAPERQRCGPLYCGGRRYEVPLPKIYDRDPYVRGMIAASAYDLSYNPANGQVHLYVSHNASERQLFSIPGPGRADVQPASYTTDDPIDHPLASKSSLSAHFDPPEGVLKADGTIDIGEITQALRQGHPVSEVYGSYQDHAAEVEVGIVNNPAMGNSPSVGRWTQSFRDVRIGGALKYDRAKDEAVESDVQEAVPRWFGAILDTVERDVKLASPIQHA